MDEEGVFVDGRGRGGEGLGEGEGEGEGILGPRC